MCPIHFSNIYLDLLFDKKTRFYKKQFKDETLFRILKYYNGQITYSELLNMNTQDLNSMLNLMNKDIKSNNETLKKLKENEQVFRNQVKYVINLGI